jgi:hypothetical protein
VFVNGVAQRIATIPAQSDWDTWTNVPLQLSLAAGNNIITLRQMPTDTGKVNLDLLSVPWWPTTEQYELESTTMLGDAKVNWNHGNFNGIGFIDKLETPGSGVNLNVDVPNDGAYTLSTRYSNGTGAAQTMSLYVNGTKIESATFAPTTNWDTWGTQNESITLHRGKSNVVFKYDAMDSGHINLDSIAIAP